MGEVGGNSGVGDTQVFNIDFADDIADLAEDFFTTNRPQAKAHIHKSQHIEVIQALNPVAILVKLAGRVNSAHHRAHGAAGDTGDVIAAAFEFFDHANMGIAPGAP